MYAKIMEIDENIAAEMLEHNTDNYRKLSRDKVTFYARKMSLGYWQENGEGIQFGKDGKLLNGQHRLKAIIESHTKQKMLVVYDVDADVFDSGKNRSLQEMANIDGATGGAITILLTKGNLNSRKFIGNEEKREYYNKHKDDLDKALLYARRGASVSIMKKSGCIAAIYCAIRMNILPDKDLEAFCRIVNSGLPEDGFVCESPLVLRKTISNTGHYGDGGRQLMAFCFDVTWQAINAFKRGLKSKHIYKPNGEAVKILNKLDE